jgi:hypothetical protein
MLSLHSYATEDSMFTIMKMKMYVILDKAKAHTENINGLNLAAVMYTTVHVSRLLQDVWAQNN